jgi:sugar O-acyltransferase (sialic acid O-acetyltransferase NeuD family)
MKRKIVIWGCGGHAREMNLLCEQIGIRVVGFLDERKEMKNVIVDNLPVLGDIDDIGKLRNEVKILCNGVGSPGLKKHFAKRTAQAGFSLVEALVHPSVYISKSNKIGINSTICEGTTLTVNIQIGDFATVNRNSTIGHDVIIEDYATISPGVNTSGNVIIKTGCFIGTGVSIKEKITIGEWSVIGGGSFVKDDVPKKVLFAGVPAKFKKNVLPDSKFFK